MKRMTSSLLYLIISFLIFILASCNYGGEINSTDDPYDYSKDYYLVEESEEGLISGKSSQIWFDNEMILCTSVSELELYVDDVSNYSDDFFTSKSIILIQFAYASEDEGNINFEVLTSYESKLYPIFSFAHNEDVSDSNKRYLLFSVEVDNSLTSKYELGNILVVDNYFSNMTYVLNDDSKYHKGFKGNFFYYDYQPAFDDIEWP